MIDIDKMELFLKNLKEGDSPDTDMDSCIEDIADMFGYAGRGKTVESAHILWGKYKALKLKEAFDIIYTFYSFNSNGDIDTDLLEKAKEFIEA